MKIRLAALITTCAAALLWYAEPLKSQNLAGICVSSKASRSDVIEACTALIEVEDTTPEYLHLFLTERAWAHMCNSSSQRALADADRALGLQPFNVKTRVLRARIHAANGDHETARKDYDLAVELAPENSYAHWNRARYLERQGERSAAFQGYQRVLELNPDASNAAMYSASHLFDTGKYQEALDLTFEAEEKWPDKRWIYDTRIQVHLMQGGDVHSALQAAKKAIALSDKTTTEHFYPIVIHLSIGDDHDGVEAVEHYAEWAAKKFQSELSPLGRIQQKLFGDPLYWEKRKILLRGMIYAAAGRGDLAHPELLEFVERSGPSGREVLEHLAEKEGAKLPEEDRLSAESIVEAYIELQLSEAPSWVGRK